MMRRLRGFTLIEVLVATVILAILSIMAHRGVAETRLAVERTRGHMERVREVQRAVTLMTADFRQLAPRPVRALVGDGYRPALERDPNAINLVEMSRDGWPNTIGAPRGTVQRVLYLVEEDKLIRRHWQVTDATLANEPVSRELLSGVEQVRIRYMNGGREWQEQWPPLGMPAPIALRARPLAVEFVIVLADYGEIRRVIEVPG
ncbi:MAG: type secretion system protein GspJ [Proteobacteria bacterium]|nr:type secretion system protein GspJ [Pseudomonadota bacterium]